MIRIMRVAGIGDPEPTSRNPELFPEISDMGRYARQKPGESEQDLFRRGASLNSLGIHFHQLPAPISYAYLNSAMNPKSM
jgi:hypothetical protein